LTISEKYLGQTFLIVKNDKNSMTDLASAIKEINNEVLCDGVSVPCLTLWKPNPIDAFPPNTIFQWVKAFLNSCQDQRDRVQLDMGAQLCVAFPPGQSLPLERIYVIAQLLLDKLVLKLVLRNGISFASAKKLN
jgi:hypothetical protein